MNKELLKQIKDKYESFDNFDNKVEFLNKIRRLIHEISPFDEPIDCIQWVKQSDINFNDYNPNEVASPEMNLLYLSIKKDGYTQPIVTFEKDNGKFEVVDGEHRTIIGKEKEDIKKRLHNYVPVTKIDKGEENRMSSTIRHNRARGTHQIRDMSNLVVELFDKGWSDEKICEELGMEIDEVLRLKQVSGLKKAFSNHEFSDSWKEYKDCFVMEEKDE